MTAFDITPLQIPVADPNLMDPNVMVGHHPHHFHSLPRPTKVPQNPNCKYLSYIYLPYIFTKKPETGSQKFCAP